MFYFIFKHNGVKAGWGGGTETSICFYSVQSEVRNKLKSLSNYRLIYIQRVPSGILVMIILFKTKLKKRV